METPKGWYTGIVNIWDLPKDKTYVDFDVETKLELYHKLLKFYSTKNNLANKLGVSLDSVRNFFDRKHTASLIFVEKIISLLNRVDKRFTDKLIENKIRVIQTRTGKKIYNVKFPLNFNSEYGAVLVSAIFHDGGIEKNKLWPFYRNYDKEKIEHLKFAFEKFLGKSELYIGKNKTIIQFPNIFGIIFVYGLGLQSGPKVKINPDIPEFLFKARKEVRIAFLKQAFDDEGTIAIQKPSIKELRLGLSVDASHLSKDFRRQIKENRIVKYAPRILKADQRLLESIDIRVNNPRMVYEYSTKNKEVRQYWEITISSKENILNFYQNVGFYLSRKQEILKSFLN